MTRTELIEKMAMTGRTAAVGASSPEQYWADLDATSKKYELRQAEAVLDILTKEAHEGVAGWGTPSEKTGQLVGKDSSTTSAVFVAGTDVSGTVLGATTARKVSIIILDLPEAPSATKRAAEYLRDAAKVVGGFGWDAEEMRSTADELERGGD